MSSKTRSLRDPIADFHDRAVHDKGIEHGLASLKPSGIIQSRPLGTQMVFLHGKIKCDEGNELGVSYLCPDGSIQLLLIAYPPNGRLNILHQNQSPSPNYNVTAVYNEHDLDTKLSIGSATSDNENTRISLTYIPANSAELILHPAG